MAMIRRELNTQELVRGIYEVMQRVKTSFPSEIREYVDVADFAPEWLKPGSKVIDPITGLRGEVIGYDERLILVQSTR